MAARVGPHANDETTVEVCDADLEPPALQKATNKGPPPAPPIETSIETISIMHHPQHPVGPRDVQNKYSMDEELSNFLGHGGKPPAVEFIFVENVQPSFFLVPKWLFGGFGPALGHAAVAFTRRDGTRCLVNIVGGRQAHMGEMIDVWETPSDYIYGVKGEEHMGGIFSRSMCCIRVQDWDPNGVEAIELYFRSMLASYKSSRAAWHNCGLCISLVTWLGFGRMRPYGNCSDWLSRGCFLAGLLRRPHTFPKAAVVDMLETLILDRPRDAPAAQVVYFKQEPESRRERKWQRVEVWQSLVSPLHILRNLVYWDLEPLADAVVTVSRTANGELRASASAGRKWRPVWMRMPPFRHFHTTMITACNVAWIIYGYPREDDARLSAILARLLLTGAVVLVNAVLN